MTYLDVLTHTSIPELISKTTGRIGNMTVIGPVVFEIFNIILLHVHDLQGPKLCLFRYLDLNYNIGISD